jgi:hypothetical protein
MSFWHDHAIAGSFERLDARDANVRVKVIVEGIGPEQNGGVVWV